MVLYSDVVLGSMVASHNASQKKLFRLHEPNGLFGTQWAIRIFVPPNRQNRSILPPTGWNQWATGRIFCTPSSPVHATFTFMAGGNVPEEIF